MKKKILNQTLYMFAIILILSFVSLHSSLVLKMDLKKLTFRASHIVHGEITDFYCCWDDSMRMIHTLYTLIPYEFIKGEPIKEKIILLFPGGTVKSKTISVVGKPKFQVGEKVFLFLEPEIRKTYRCVGSLQGKYRIIDDMIIENGKPLRVFIEEIQTILNSFTNQ